MQRLMPAQGAKNKWWLGAHPFIDLLVRQRHGRGNRRNIEVGWKEKCGKCCLQGTVQPRSHSSCGCLRYTCTRVSVNSQPQIREGLMGLSCPCWTTGYWQILEAAVSRCLPNGDSSKPMGPQATLLKSVRSTPSDKAPLKTVANRCWTFLGTNCFVCRSHVCRGNSQLFTARPVTS